MRASEQELQTEGDHDLDVAARVIGEFLFLPSSPLRAQASIVFGMTRWHRPVERALALHRDGLAGVLVFTGGWNTEARVVEAQAMAGAARAQGLPAQRMLIEPRAANTAENVSESMAALSAAGYAPVGLRLNLVTIAWHARRVLLTARSRLHDSTALGLVTYPSLYFSQTDWHRDPRGRRSVFGELVRIERYFGAVAPGEVREAHRWLAHRTRA